jgi:UDP-N-acetylglucosamine--N-acetylmuramyl-(pentapeptide) pyrophosphoryl-undecaprenol N-acetylglucosamine transferase
MRILIAGGGTGGHLMPALALADALVAERGDVEPVLVGAERGVEARLLPSRPWRYHLLPAEPIHRRAWWRNFRWPLILTRLLREGSRVLAEERPVLAVGTGGYAAGPILTQALRRGIPVALQEQNAYPGFTTRRLARRARQIHLGFPEARRHLSPGPATEVFEFGNPIVPPPSPHTDRAAAREKLSIATDARVVFVTGGSQGARSINRAVAAALSEGLLDDVVVLWGTGMGMWEQYRGFDLPPRRRLRAFWDPIGQAYAACDLVVARAGAMSTAEICAWGLPSVLIPLPTAAAGHQSENAEALARGGAAVHLPDPLLGGGRLAEEVQGLLADPERLTQMGVAAAARGHPNASQNIARQLLAIVS